MSHDWKFIFLLAIASIPLITYLATSMQAALAMRSSKKRGKKPPILPYSIPYIGHLITFFWNGPWLTVKIVEIFGQSVPVGLRLGPVKVYLVGDSGLVDMMFKLVPEVSSIIGAATTLKNVFGTPGHIIPLYSRDNSGPLPKPVLGSRVLPGNRIQFFHAKAAQQHLAGTNGIALAKRYMDILSRTISSKTTIGTQWVEFADLWLFIRNLVFPASTESLCGSLLLSLNPTLTEDFWAFDRSVPTLLKGFPRWLCPSAYKSRDKMLESIKRWHVLAIELSDFSRTGVNDPAWDPYLGSKYIKSRQRFLHEIEIMNADGRASEDLGLIFAASGNTIPVAFWAIFEVFTRPHLLTRVRHLARTAYDTRDQESEPITNGSIPLFQSIFAEVTRLRVSGIIPRFTTGGDFQLGEWSIPQGAMIGLPSQTGAMNKDVWNAGTEDHPHPLETFWEERFLIYADNPNSGPLRKQDSAFSCSKQGSPVQPPSPEEAASEPTFSLKGLNGAYIPFGGGPRTCPGRHFAREEVIGTLTKLALEFDIELQVAQGWEPRMDTAFFPLGTLPPRDKVPFRIRRRLL